MKSFGATAGRAVLTVLLLTTVTGAAPAARWQERGPTPVSPEELRGAVGKLGDLDYPTRMKAGRAIRRAPGAVAVPALLDAVREHADGYIRFKALILLTGGALAGRPDLGLEAVALWTLVSTLFLLLRLGMAAYARATAGPLTSWLAEVGRDPSDHPLAVRWFAGGSGRSPGATARSCRRGP